MKPLLWASAILSIFAPIEGALLACFVVVVIDLISGIYASRKQAIPITSSGLKRTIAKVFIYELGILLGFIIEKYLTGSFVPCCKLVTTLIGVTELKSVLENLDIIYGGNLWKSLINRLSAGRNTDSEV